MSARRDSSSHSHSRGASRSRSHTPRRTASLESSSCETCAQMSQLEVEAFTAVQEMALFVKSVSVSEVLSRTPELIFLNLVTLEENTYCVELTQRGWRICSDRADCMYGDFRKLELHAKYFETIYALLDDVSPAYRDRFGAALSEKLSKLQRESGHGSAESDAAPQNGSGPQAGDSEEPSD